MNATEGGHWAGNSASRHHLIELFTRIATNLARWVRSRNVLIVLSMYRASITLRYESVGMRGRFECGAQKMDDEIGRDGEDLRYEITVDKVSRIKGST